MPGILRRALPALSVLVARIFASLATNQLIVTAIIRFQREIRRYFKASIPSHRHRHRNYHI